VRKHISSDLSFSRAHREAQVRRLAFIAQLLARNGVDVIVAAVSPFRDARAAARASIGAFVEVHVATPLAECARRDPKGLYAKARDGLLPNLTGVQDPYEEPLAPELRLDTSGAPVDACVARVLETLEALGHLPE
jgi:sulfate adenylyltransferase